MDINLLKAKIIDLITDEDLQLKNFSENEMVRRVKQEKYDTIQNIINIIDELS